MKLIKYILNNFNKNDIKCIKSLVFNFTTISLSPYILTIYEKK